MIAARRDGVPLYYHGTFRRRQSSAIVACWKTSFRSRRTPIHRKWIELRTISSSSHFNSSAIEAPIADELKCDNEEIVRNSIHLRWIGVRRDLKDVFQHAAIADDWHRQNLP